MRALTAIFVALTCTTAVAQTVVYNASVYGATVLSPSTTTYTHIYVVFPPQASGTNNAQFKANVMTQSAIDGVTMEVPWAVVEINPPTQVDCRASMPPDLCQPDPVATSWFHTYDMWSAIDGNGMGCTDYGANSSAQWFCSFGGVYKKVNFVLVGTGGSPTNSTTPAYVTGASWIAAASPTYLHQDVVNTINASNCGGYSGSIVSGAPGGSTFTGDGASPSVISVSKWTSPPLSNGDTIWVSGFGTGAFANFNVAGQYGSTVHLGNTSPCSTAPGVDFCYTGSGTINLSQTVTSTIGVIKAVDSWTVPYENPYSGAWQAFLTAAVYHFNHYANLNQIAYIRPGVARGGEAIPLCTAVGPLGGGAPGTNPGYSKTTWETWYTTVNSAVQAAQPQMQIMYSLNAGDVLSPDATYATAEAGIAVSYGSATGQHNGFGSQGLQATDIGSFGTCPGSGAPSTSNNWGCMFTQYWSGGSTPTTVPLELQQVDCSNPNGYLPMATSNCLFGGGAGLTGNLGNVYSFATTNNHASILELYLEDALLAFDPNYCIILSGSCTGSSDSFGSALSTDAQYDFFNAAGIGPACAAQYSVPSPGSGTGGCAYANAISAAHGPH